MDSVGNTARDRLAVSGTEYPHRPLTEVIEIAESLRITNLELWIPHNFRWEELSTVETELSKRGLRAVVISTWTQLNLPGDVAPRQELIKQSIMAAKALGARSVNTYFGANPQRTPEEAIKNYCTAIAPCLDLAIRENIYITLENEFEQTGSDITRRAVNLRALVEAIGCPAFKLNFDPCNFYFAGEEPYPFAYRLLKDHIGYVHLKDGMKFHPGLYAPPEEGFLWKDRGGDYICCPVGKGAIHFEALLPEILNDGFTGYIGLEPHVPPHALAHAFAETVDFVQGYFKHINQGESQ